MHLLWQCLFKGGNYYYPSLLKGTKSERERDYEVTCLKMAMTEQGTQLRVKLVP